LGTVDIFESCFSRERSREASLKCMENILY